MTGTVALDGFAVTGTIRLATSASGTDATFVPCHVGDCWYCVGWTGDIPLAGVTAVEGALLAGMMGADIGENAGCGGEAPNCGEAVPIGA